MNQRHEERCLDNWSHETVVTCIAMHNTLIYSTYKFRIAISNREPVEKIHVLYVQSAMLCQFQPFSDRVFRLKLKPLRGSPLILVFTTVIE